MHLLDIWHLGGVSRVVASIADWQAVHGHEVHIVAGHTEELSLANPVEVNPALNQSGSLTELLSATLAIRQLDVRFKPEVIHVHHRGLALAALMATGRSRRVVEHVHGPQTDQRVASFRARTTLAVGWGMVDMVVHGYKRDERRVFRVINGVADLGWHPPPRSSPRRVGGLGRLSQEKGPDRFIDMANVLAARSPGIQCCWMGWGPMEDDIRDAPHVRYIDAHPDPVQYLSSLSVVVSTSRRDSMTLALIEAMSVGRPVVATAVGSVRDVVEDGITGRLVAGNAQPGEIAEAVEWVLAPERFDQLAAAARQRYTQHFTAEDMCRSIDAAYRAAGLMP